MKKNCIQLISNKQKNSTNGHALTRKNFFGNNILNTSTHLHAKKTRLHNNPAYHFNFLYFFHYKFYSSSFKIDRRVYIRLIFSKNYSIGNLGCVGKFVGEEFAHLLSHLAEAAAQSLLLGIHGRKLRDQGQLGPLQLVYSLFLCSTIQFHSLSISYC